jgi:hypothetical protein
MELQIRLGHEQLQVLACCARRWRQNEEQRGECQSRGVRRALRTAYQI